jgi:hypothetical protein
MLLAFIHPSFESYKVARMNDTLMVTHIVTSYNGMMHWDIKPYKFNSRYHPQPHNDSILCYPCATNAGILNVATIVPFFPKHIQNIIYVSF